MELDSIAAISTEAIAATYVYPNYVKLYASLFMWPKLVTNHTSASLLNEGEPLGAMV